MSGWLLSFSINSFFFVRTQTRFPAKLLTRRRISFTPGTRLLGWKAEEPASWSRFCARRGNFAGRFADLIGWMGFGVAH